MCQGTVILVSYSNVLCNYLNFFWPTVIIFFTVSYLKLINKINVIKNPWFFKYLRYFFGNYKNLKMMC